LHPEAQQKALAGLLDQVGWVQDVIVNQRTGHVVDGHLRVALAIGRQEAAIPVVYVDLSEHEEQVVLASLDPLGAMAASDADALSELLAGVAIDSDDLRAALEKVTPATAGPPGDDPGIDYRPQYGVTVICSSESEQERVYDELRGRGYECRVVVV